MVKYLNVKTVTAVVFIDNRLIWGCLKTLCWDTKLNKIIDVDTRVDFLMINKPI